MLQRYTLVAHLAPEIQHGMSVVRKQHGIAVDGVVTCGDLPDLRSLTMPLIEELDMEVETLDTLEGLDVSPAAVAQRAVDYAPALRLAAAVATLPGTTDPPRTRWWGRAAAVGVLIAGLGWWAASGLPSRRDQLLPRPAPEMPAPAATAGTSEPAIVPLIPRAGRSTPRTPPAEPLPAVASILIGATRRLAILDGTIVGEGDSVGNRLRRSNRT